MISCQDVRGYSDVNVQRGFHELRQMASHVKAWHFASLSQSSG